MNKSPNSKVELQNVVICSNLLVKSGDYYYVLKRSPRKSLAPNYVVPFGGKLLPNEGIIDCAIRELKEESGLSVKNIQLFAIVTEFHKSPKMMADWVSYYFIADYKSGTVTETPEGECLEININKLADENLFPTFRAILPYINSGERPVIATIHYDENQELTHEDIRVC